MSWCAWKLRVSVASVTSVNIFSSQSVCSREKLVIVIEIPLNIVFYLELGYNLAVVLRPAQDVLGRLLPAGAAAADRFKM